MGVRPRILHRVASWKLSESCDGCFAESSQWRRRGHGDKRQQLVQWCKSVVVKMVEV